MAGGPLTHESTSHCETSASLQEASELEGLLRAARPCLVASEGPLPSVLRNGQLRLINRLGSGSMGTVYEASDGGQPIALKSLNRCSGEQIYRFKQEFRLLADISHPHVIRMRELFMEEERWFFTMELIRGSPIDRYVLDHQNATTHEGTARSRAHFEALRGLIHQLVEGVAAVHRVGLIHRDLKPSNVLVEHGGRVVILDFGLVSAPQEARERGIAGTPGYLAPEVALHASVMPAGDWYAVGVMLYEILTRRSPMHGTLAELLHQKATQDPAPPAALCPDVPADLNELCCALLQREPASRPSADQLLALCRSWQTPRAPREAPARPLSRFIGRSRLLDNLVRVYRLSRREPQLVLIDGGSGMGKSAVLTQLGEQLELIDAPIVLQGRCHERERVPYKGLDAIMDACVRMLLRLPEEQVAQLLPQRIGCLSRLFPALLRVGLVREAAERETTPVEPSELQQGAIEALQELFTRVSERRPLVLLIDDLHWADADGLQLLAALLSPPLAPHMLVVGSRQLGLFEQAAARWTPLGMPPVITHHFVLETLSACESVELAAQFVPSPTATARIADAAGGVPEFLLELTQHFARDPQLDGPLSLEALLGRRIQALRHEQHRVLELLAVAGRPLPVVVLKRVLHAGSADDALSELRNQKLIASTNAHGAVVLYHESVAQVVRRALDGPSTQRHYHTLIALLLATDPQPDAELLALFYEAIGETEHAARLTVQGAECAARALAFERAAELYAKAFELYGARAVPEKLYLEAAQANANCGRGSQAAHLYLRLSQQAEPEQAIKLSAQAALHWARCGYVSAGTTQLRSVLRHAGLRWPRTQLGTALGLGVRRGLMRLSELRPLTRARSVERHAPIKLDALYPAYTAFGTFDYLRGAYFTACALPLARLSSDPRHLLAALTAEAIFCVVLGGTHAGRRTQKLRGEIRALVSASGGDAFNLAAADLAASITAYWQGNWEDVVEPARRAELRFRTETTNGAWEANLARSVRQTVQRHSGQLHAMKLELASGLRMARTQRDLYAWLDLARAAVSVALAEDDTAAIEAAHAEVLRVRQEYPVMSLHYLLMSLEVSTALYTNERRSARALFARYRSECRRAGLLHCPLLRLMLAGMQIDCVPLDECRFRAQSANSLRRLARQVEREPVAWAPALGASARATASALGGHHDQARAELANCMRLFRERGMFATAAGVQMRLGTLLPGSVGERLYMQAESQLKALDIADPLRWSRLVHSLY